MSRVIKVRTRKPRRLVLGADGFSLPIEAVTESIGILAKRRAGKSTTARRLTEQLHKAKQQIVIVDPKGDWWGLLYGRDGKRPGLPFIVLGGGHGHVKLELGGGEIVARLVVEERVNLILDLSHFRKEDIPKFMTPFLETVYRLKAQEQYRTAMMLIIDEADAIAPQKPERGGERLMASAVEDIVRRGGQRGMGCLMITQRSAVLSKNVLTQIGILIILRTISPQDLKAMDAWITAHGTPLERAAVREALPTMAPGEAFVWAPGWPNGRGIFQRVQMALPETFDSSSTPTAGHRTRAPKHPARVNLGALERRMAATIAEQKANDPKALREKAAEAATKLLDLQRKYDALVAERDQLARAMKGRRWRKQIRDLDRKQARILRAHHNIVEIFTTIEMMTKARGEAEQLAWTSLHQEADRYLAMLKRADSSPKAPIIPMIPDTAAKRQAIREMLRIPIASVGPDGMAARPDRADRADRADTSQAIPGAELNTLRAIVGAGTVTRQHLKLLVGLRRTTVNAYVQRLDKRGLVTVTKTDITPTAAGRQIAGNVEQPPTGAALVAWWLDRLPAGEAAIFKLVLDGVADRDELTTQSGLKRSTRNAYLSRLGTRGLVQIDSDDKVRPASFLTGA